jgi:hypothetical protein
VTEPIFTGRCVRCGLAIALHDEFATVEQFAALWLKVHECQGAKVAAPMGGFEAAAAKHQADTAAHQANNGARVDAQCPECAALGLKSKKGYAPKFWPKENGPDQCDGLDGSGAYMNHRRKPVTAS